MTTLAKRFQFQWILSPSRDLLFYIGSASVGWLYIALVYFLGREISKPMTEPITTLQLGSVQFAITLELLVYMSWAFLLDAPHVFATLARTYLDPDEWTVRRREMNISWLWFLAGPAAVLTPFVVNRFYPLSAGMLTLGNTLFLIFFRLWAYYHVVRQHFGFFSLYKRKANEPVNSLDSKIDIWAFNILMYAPLVSFMSASWYSKSGLGVGSPKPIGE